MNTNFKDIEVDIEQFDDGTRADIETFLDAHQHNAELFDELVDSHEDLQTELDELQERMSDYTDIDPEELHEIANDFAEDVVEANPTMFEDAEEVLDTFGPMKTIQKGKALAGSSQNNANPPKPGSETPEEGNDYEHFDRLIESEVSGVVFRDTGGA